MGCDGEKTLFVGGPVQWLQTTIPLVHLDTARLGAVEQRWVAQLANYSFDIIYRPGSSNQNADFLSRLPGTQAVNALTVQELREEVVSLELQG